MGRWINGNFMTIKNQQCSGMLQLPAPLWERHWQGIIPFLAYPEFIRKAIYTTNAIESLNHSLRKITKNRGAFPNDEAALRLLFLGLQNAAKKWTMPIKNWKGALNQFAIMYADRFPANWL